ncbi:MAG TPA: DUF3306 domain-containing protein [Salinisphaeraceae bacterium]|nr:DUF3306 domain-containing protein [Salinisphaeraceae bacterium]
MSGKKEQSPVHHTDASEEGFFQRWSRRKLATTETAPVSESVPPAPQPAAPESGITEPEPGDEDMPALDSLGPDSDFSAFFSSRVSEQLRQAALKRLFQQPQFNVTDGLDDYCEDYRNFKPLGEVITADMRHRLAMIQEKLQRLAQDAPEEGAENNPELSARPELPGGDEESDGHA